MKKTYQRLPESELDIMLVLWNNTPPMTRPEIEKVINTKKKLASTTILSLLTRYKHYTPERLEKAKRMSAFMLQTLKYVTLTCLALGLIWCAYFLVLAMMKPELADYADNMSELIVSVLTVISIIFAFFEFIRRKD